ncbi:MAG: glycoside hydrolase family 13 protein, partial [Clostridia bacterium]|nr:glycoside hydrolase family 13 protein [Clostridia bacterium]
AIACGTSVHFRIVLPRDLKCSGAFLSLKDDMGGDTNIYGMFWAGMVGDDHEQWECDVNVNKIGLYWYHFGLETCHGRRYIMKGGFGEGYLGMSECEPRYQLTCYDADFKTPDWLPGGIMYQIFPDRFYFSGEKKDGIYPDKKIQEDWNSIPDWRPNGFGMITNSDFFQGDLKGIQMKLPYLQELGVTCIYLNPIFEAYSNHRYDTGDYEKIDPILGTEADFKELCAEAKKLGIRIINDGVFSHTGSDSKYFNREGRYHSNGAYNSMSSPYYTWYKFIQWPNIYNSWWGFNTLPEVEELSNSFNEYINGENGIVRKWIKNGNSGWRLDVADELPDEFIEHIREAIKAEDPEALLLGEVWEDASNKESYGSRRRFLYGKELDSVMNYPFRDAILGFLDCGDGKYMLEMIMTIVENYPRPVLRSLMNHLGTHDTERVITLLAGERLYGRGREWQASTMLSPEQREYGLRRMRLASGILYTLPGVPCIYYGDEVGVEGYKDPFNRRTFPWGHEDKDLLQWYKDLGKMRHSCSCLVDGDLIDYNSEGRTMAYLRADENDMLLCVFNAADYTITFRVPDEFIGGETFMNTNLDGNELVIPRDSCAFVKIKTPEKPVIIPEEDQEKTEKVESYTDHMPEDVEIFPDEVASAD